MAISRFPVQACAARGAYYYTIKTLMKNGDVPEWA